MKGESIYWFGGVLCAIYVVAGWLAPLLIGGIVGASCWGGLLLALGGHALLAVLVAVSVLLTRLALPVERPKVEKKERSDGRE